MKVHDPELLSALVDGELKGVRRILVERHLRGCAICAQEYRQLRRLRTVLQSTAGNAPMMSDTPEFFWSKVKRQIQAQHEPAEASILNVARQQQLVLATCASVVIATLVIVAVLQHRHLTSAPTFARNLSTRKTAIFAKVENVSTAIPDTDATALESGDDHVAVIWVSGLPWTQDMTEMKTHYANLDI